jgi:hypothetical protein
LQRLADFSANRFCRIGRRQANDRGGCGETESGHHEAEVCETELGHVFEILSSK